MRWNRKSNLRLGSNVVESLLPQRRPFLMVDFIRCFEDQPVPALEAGRHISANEGVFDGHFPRVHLWPGALTIEGLGQAGLLLITLVALRRAAVADGREPDSVLEVLRNLDLGFRLQPGYRPELLEGFRGRRAEMLPRIALGTSVEMKFVRPVFAGQRLDYRVELTGEHGGGMRFEAEACVDGEVVAAGVLMGAVVAGPIPDAGEGVP